MHFFELGSTKGDKRPIGTAAPIPQKKRKVPNAENFSYAALSRAASLGNLDQAKMLEIDPKVLN